MTSDRRKDPEFQYPYQQSLCQKHRLATRIWRGIDDPTKHTETCQCCGRKVGLIEFKKNCKPNSSQFSFLGPGIPLFFKFVKYSAVLLVVFSLVFSIYGLYTNINSNNCDQNQECVVTVFNSMSIVNKKVEFYLLRIQNYILLTFVLCCFILLHIFRYMFRKTQNVIDKLNVSASDYSIIIKRLPHDVTDKGIRRMVDQQISAKNFQLQKIQHQTGVKQNSVDYKIEQIVLSYDVTKFLAEKQNQLDEFKNSIKNNTVENFVFKEIPQPNQLGEIAIIVFSDQQTKDYFIYEPSFWQRLINYFFSAFPPLSDIRVNGKLVAIERAPQPEDILWQNAHITPWERTKKKIFLNFASFILLIMGGLCQYGLAVWQIKIEDPTDKFLIGTVASICVTVSNTILTTFLHYSTIWERMGTHSQYLQVLTFKLIIQQFLNAGVFVVGANVLADFSDSMLENSLADTITQIMILNAITPNLTAFIMNHLEVMGRINRFIFLRTGFFTITQHEANLLYELPKPDFTENYSYVVKTLWLTAFYAPFVPIVVPISAMGLGIKYFVEKFLFSRSYSIANKISASLNRSCMEGLEYIPLIFSIGQFLIFIYLQTFFEEAPEDWLIPIYVCLGLSFLNLVLPMEDFNQRIERYFKEFTPKVQLAPKVQIARKNEKKTFEKAKEQFEITYEMTYPASKVGKGKRKDTFFKISLQSDEKPSQSRFKLISTEFNQNSLFNSPIAKLQNNNPKQQRQYKQEIKQQDDSSQLDLNIVDTSCTPSLLKQNIDPVIQQTQLLMVKKTTCQKEEVVKFSAISSTKPNDSEMGSICEFPIRPIEIQPEPGKKVGQIREENDGNNSLQGAKKLFEHYEKKKVSNGLIEIKQQQHDEEEKATPIQ